MWPYWLMYAAPALAALLAAPGRKSAIWPPWLLLGLFFTLCIGFREHVGGDWGNYLPYYTREIGAAFTDPLKGGDIGYVLLNRLMARLEWGIYGVNTVCGLIFVSGLIAFCRAQYRAWLAFAVAVPYIVIVVAMGYTRQGVALGLIFFGLTRLEQGKFLQYAALITLAAMFHKTAMIMIPLGMFLYQKGWLFRAAAVALIGHSLWDALMAPSLGNLWASYVEQRMFSQGAVIRVAMNCAAAFFLFVFWKEWKRTYPNALLWLWMACAAVASVFLVGLAPTAVDRLGLYLTPLQVAVFSRLPYLARRQQDPEVTARLLLLAYGAALFVWLHYAVHARYWLPYRNALFE
ncbi:EpsG family protein [Candidatus Electronema sp. TJ]|uniref:EpsG family protein n=1 Tax=Candidatus Electronema sp. TJ TaxID=3401573 RepID=UPI003AA8172C